MLISRRKFLSKELIAAASIAISESERKIINEFEALKKKIKEYYNNTFGALSKIHSDSSKPPENPEKSSGKPAETSSEDKEKYIKELQENLHGLIFYLAGVILETPENNKYIEVNFAAAYDSIATSYCDKIISLLENDELAKVIFEAEDKKTLHRLVSELKKDIKNVAETISSLSMVKRSKSDENIIWDEYTIEYKRDDELASNDEMFQDAIDALLQFHQSGKRQELSSQLSWKVAPAIDNVYRRYEIYNRGKTMEAKDHLVQVANNFIHTHLDPERMKAGKELYTEFVNILNAIVTYGRSN